MIKRLPIKDTYLKHSDVDTGLPYDPETGWAGTEGPYLAYGTPSSHRGECDAVVIKPTFTFTKQEIENLCLNTL